MYSKNPNRSESSDLNNTLIYYPEEYDYSIHYENEIGKHQPAAHHRAFAEASHKMPTCNYFNERKCPIYVHDIKKNSSVYNNFNLKLATPKRTVFSRNAPQNNSKFVLDKLEETYWATWKPKKESPRPNFLVPDYSRPRFQGHNKGSSLHDGAISDDVIKYFKAERFDSSSTTDSAIKEIKQKKVHPILAANKSHLIKRKTISNERIKSDKQDKKLQRPTNSRQIKMVKNECQEIQTEVHCPIILEEKQLETNNYNIHEELGDKTIDEKVDMEAQPTSKSINKLKSKKEIKKLKLLGKNNTKKEIPATETHFNDIKIENEANSQEDTNATLFVEHKDSIEVIKKQQEQSGPKEHSPQPKSIKLYRKSGSAAGYIRGGTYPLKSCLKRNSVPKGNFKLGPPGSPLFVTTSSVCLVQLCSSCSKLYTPYTRPLMMRTCNDDRGS